MHYPAGYAIFLLVSVILYYRDFAGIQQGHKVMMFGQYIKRAGVILCRYALGWSVEIYFKGRIYLYIY